MDRAEYTERAKSYFVAAIQLLDDKDALREVGLTYVQTLLEASNAARELADLGPD